MRSRLGNEKTDRSGRSNVERKYEEFELLACVTFLLKARQDEVDERLQREETLDGLVEHGVVARVAPRERVDVRVNAQDVEQTPELFVCASALCPGQEPFRFMDSKRKPERLLDPERDLPEVDSLEREVIENRRAIDDPRLVDPAGLGDDGAQALQDLLACPGLVHDVFLRAQLGLASE